MAQTGQGTSTWGVVLLGGVIAAVLGLVILFNPFDSVRVLTVLVGISLAIAGIFGIVASARGTSRMGVAGPIVALIGGLVLMFIPGGSVKTAAVVLGIVVLAFGVVTTVVALTGAKELGWAPTVGGLVLAILGLIVVVWPGPSISFVAILVGLAVLVSGLTMVVQAFRMRGAKGS